MFEWFHLDEAAAIITDATGKRIGARDLLRMAFAGELKVISVIPGWESPGVGDLVFYSLSDSDNGSDSVDPVSARMTSVTDGAFQHLGKYDFRTLWNHGRLPLAHKKVVLRDSDGAETDWVIGPDAPTITVDDLRVSADELARIQGLPAKAAPTDATDFRQEGGHQDSTCDDWTVQARAIADELDAIDATAKSHDSLTNIADRVEARMRERGVHGPRGPLTGKTILREGDVAREQPIPESQTDEGHRKRRIELIEEEERARLRVRDEWQRERQGTVGEADQDSRPELTPMKRKAIIERLGRRYPALESAVDRPEEWAKACRVPKEASPDGKQGWYYLERIEAECRTRYGGAAPTPAADLSLAGQLHDINR